MKGPAGKPPLSGWNIAKLPEDAKALQAEWMLYSSREPVNGAKDALWKMTEFLKSNGFTGLDKEVRVIAVDQWCGPEPRRCTGYVPSGVKPDVVVASGDIGPRWASQVWRLTNFMLHDDVKDEDAQGIITNISDFLTRAIEGPDGCMKCAVHWSEVRDLFPPVANTLQEAREWLVTVHNESREGKPPRKIADVAKDFGWTLS